MISYMFLKARADYDPPEAASDELVVCQFCGAVVTYGMWVTHSNFHYADHRQFASRDHQHEYEGYAGTAGPRCRICGRTPPEMPNTTVSATTT